VASEPSVRVLVSEKMKTPPRKNDQDPGQKRRSGAPESKASSETFPRRTDLPGKSGLATEARPGLGSRQSEPLPGEPGDAKLPAGETKVRGNVAKRQRSSLEPNDQPLPRDPQEQGLDPWARESERDTGVSGHLGG
jgi:hypothetical protein